MQSFGRQQEMKMKKGATKKKVVTKGFPFNDPLFLSSQDFVFYLEHLSHFTH